MQRKKKMHHVIRKKKMPVELQDVAGLEMMDQSVKDPEEDIWK